MAEKNENIYRIPHRVNAPLSIAFWNVDQIVPVFTAIGVGSVFRMMDVALVFAVVYFIVIGRIKERYARGFVTHKLWWLGFMPIGNSPSVPDPMHREFFQ